MLSHFNRTAPELVFNRAATTSFRQSRTDCFGADPCSHMPKRTKLRGKLARFLHKGLGVKAPLDSLMETGKTDTLVETRQTDSYKKTATMAGSEQDECSEMASLAGSKQEKTFINGLRSHDRTGKEITDGLHSRDWTGRKFTDGLHSMTGQAESSQTASIAITGQTGISQMASIALTGQAESLQMAFIAVTGQTESWQVDTTRGSAVDAITSGGSTAVISGNRESSFTFSLTGQVQSSAMVPLTTT